MGIQLSSLLTHHLKFADSADTSCADQTLPPQESRVWLARLPVTAHFGTDSHCPGLSITILGGGGGGGGGGFPQLKH